MAEQPNKLNLLKTHLQSEIDRVGVDIFASDADVDENVTGSHLEHLHEMMSNLDIAFMIASQPYEVPAENDTDIALFLKRHITQELNELAPFLLEEGTDVDDALSILDLFTRFNKMLNGIDVYMIWRTEGPPLDPDQRAALFTCISRHFLATLQVHKCQILPADTGWGKTNVSMHAAWIHEYVFERESLWIVPPNICIQTIEQCEAVGLSKCQVISYNILRGNVGKKKLVTNKDGDQEEVRAKAKINHPYLTRENNPTGPFRATREWMELISRGVFIVFDESQNMKNKQSATHWAGFELCRTALLSPEADCAILHLSASLIDKLDNWQSLFRLCGLIPCRELYKQNPATRELEWRRHGVGKMFDLACLMNNKVAREVIQVQEDVSAKALPAILEELWTRIFRSEICIPVVDPIYVNPENDEPYARVRNNLFITLNEEGQEMAAAANDALRRLRIVDDHGNFNVAAANNNMAQLQNALMMLCHAKVNDLARVCLDRLNLDEDGTCTKVIICAPFKVDQQKLQKELKPFGVLVLNGDVDMAARPDVMDKFNAPNDDYRVLIMTPSVGGVGVSLHDTHGGFPRVMYIMPSFHFLGMFQAAGRTYRRGLRSDVEVNIVYANNSGLESLIVNGMIKSKVGENVMCPGSGRVFPGAFDCVIEDEDPALHGHLREEMERIQNASTEELRNRTF